MKKLYCLFILITIISCSSRKEKVIVPHDFCIIFTSETEEINSFTSTVKRKYNHGDTTIHVEFSKNEIETIYKAMLENQPLVSPKENGKVGFILLPSLESRIQIEMNGNVYQMAWTSNDTTSKELKKFLKTIYGILESKDEYKNLPKTDIVFF